MLADLAQERNIFEGIEPIGIVDHHCVGGSVPERQESLEYLADRGNIGVDVLSRKQLAAFILARRIANLGCTSAHQDDGLVPGLLQPTEHHDLHHRTDMQRRRGRIETDIGGDDLLHRKRIKRRCVGHLMDIAARAQRV